MPNPYTSGASENPDREYRPIIPVTPNKISSTTGKTVSIIPDNQSAVTGFKPLELGIQPTENSIQTLLRSETLNPIEGFLEPTQELPGQMIFNGEMTPPNILKMGPSEVLSNVQGGVELFLGTSFVDLGRCQDRAAVSVGLKEESNGTISRTTIVSLGDGVSGAGGGGEEAPYTASALTASYVTSESCARIFNQPTNEPLQPVAQIVNQSLKAKTIGTNNENEVAFQNNIRDKVQAKINTNPDKEAQWQPYIKSNSALNKGEYGATTFVGARIVENRKGRFSAKLETEIVGDSKVVILRQGSNAQIYDGMSQNGKPNALSISNNIPSQAKEYVGDNAIPLEEGDIVLFMTDGIDHLVKDFNSLPTELQEKLDKGTLTSDEAISYIREEARKFKEQKDTVRTYNNPAVKGPPKQVIEPANTTFPDDLTIVGLTINKY